jgi:beta-glucosidase-like glycosyl hydrolase
VTSVIPESSNPARLIMPALRSDALSGFAHEAGRIADTLEIGVGGYIIFGGTAESVRRLTADLLRRAGRPLLLASDLERGAGQQVSGLTEFPPPMALASLNDPAVVRWAGSVTAQEARAVGINWVFAPVADLDLLPENPIVQTRAFGADPNEVATYVRQWIEGCQTAGALACAKHYPGHGRTSVDSHVTLPVVDAPAADLETDHVPFTVAIQSGVASIMTAHVAYPALDSSGLPATLSRTLLGRLRGAARFDGLVVTDALIMDGALVGRRESDAAVEAVQAGADLLLYPNDSRRVKEALEAALSSSALPRERIQESLRRYYRALAAATAPTPPVTRGPYESADALADALLKQGMMMRRPVPELTGPLDLVVVDDDIGGPYPPGPSDYVHRALGSDLIGRYGGGSRVLLVFAEPRAWKGRSGFGPATKEALAHHAAGADLIVLFGHPRLAAELPSSAPVLLAWHRQKLMQEAAARWLRRRLG